jgi:hypothetical protein
MKKAILVTVEAPDGTDEAGILSAVEFALDDAANYGNHDTSEWTDVAVASAGPGPWEPGGILGRLRNVADDYESDTLDQLLDKARFAWQCRNRLEEGHACGYRSPVEDGTCGNCGAPRPEHREGEA